MNTILKWQWKTSRRLEVPRENNGFLPRIRRAFGEAPRMGSTRPPIIPKSKTCQVDDSEKHITPISQKLSKKIMTKN